MKILVDGLPGSGKTTQSKLLASFLNVPIIGSGEILREIANRTDQEAREIKKVMDSGQLVSDKTISKLVKERVARKDCQNGFVMEGYPRTKIQLETFDPQFDKAFYLNIDEETALERLSGRGRSDDSLRVAKKRLEVQRKDLQGIIDYYKSKGILVEMDGKLDIESLQGKIKESLNG